MDERFLLKVEDYFNISGQELFLWPFIPLEKKLPKSAKILLILPDGGSLETEAKFEVPHFSFSSPEARKHYRSGYVCILKEVKKESVTVETEVWLN